MTNSLIEYIHLGGYVMYILVFLNIVGLSIMLYKIIELKLAYKKSSNNIQQIYNKSKEEVDNREFVKDYLYQQASKKLLSYEFGMNTIKIIATIAPILGLLGTVIGVLDAFTTISKTGLGGGANAFASGISLALITTIGGLVVALPHYIGYNYLIGMLTKLETLYEEHLIKKLMHEKIS